MDGGQLALRPPIDTYVGCDIDAIRVIHKHHIEDRVISMSDNQRIFNFKLTNVSPNHVSTMYRRVWHKMGMKWIRVSTQFGMIICHGSQYRYYYYWRPTPITGLPQHWVITGINDLDEVRSALREVDYLEHLKTNMKPFECRLVDVTNVRLKATWV